MCDGFCFLVLGDECHCVPCEVVHKDQDILDAQWLVKLHSCFYAGEVNMNQL